MGKDTKIQWCHHTFNGWIGCSEAGPECDNCYARELNKHWKWNGGEWGPGALRKITSSAKWREPLKWNRDAEAAGERRRVFAFSLGDFADAEAPQDAYPYLWELVDRTPWLDWMFLTKRPGRIVKIVPKAWLDKPPRNVWWGTSVGTQKTADALVPALLRVPAAIRFLSMEPLLEAVDLSRWLVPFFDRDDGIALGTCDWGDCNERAVAFRNDAEGHGWLPVCATHRAIHLIIVGGESGHGARPMRLEWARSIVEQCKAAGVAAFVKQLGPHPFERAAANLGARQGYDPQDLLADTGPRPPQMRGWTLIKTSTATWYQRHLQVVDKKGGDPSEWPEDLRVRQFPEADHA